MKCFLASFLMVAGAFSGCPPRAGAGEPPTRRRLVEPRVLAHFEMAKGGDVIVLPVTIAGKEYPFLLGASLLRVCVDSRLRPVLGQSLGHKPLQRGSSQTVEEFPSARLTVGNQSFSPAAPLVCIDLAAVREACGYDIHGLLGIDFLRDRIVQIDFDAGELRVLDAVPGAVRDGPAELLFRNDAGLGVLMRLSNFRSPTFLLDTLQYAPVALRTRLLDDLESQGMITAPRGAEGPRPIDNRQKGGILDELTLSDWTHKGLLAIESNCERVGLEYLSRFRLTFDLTDPESYWVYWTPGARFDRPQTFDWCGMNLVRRDARTIVRDVAERSTASRSGIEPGDILVAIDGKPAAERSLFEIRRLFLEDRAVTAQFKRPADDGEFTARLECPAPLAAGLKSLGADTRREK